MRRQVTKVLSTSTDNLVGFTFVETDGVKIRLKNSVPYLGELKIPYTLTADELKVLTDFEALQLKLAQLVFPVKLIEVIYNNGDDKILTIRGEQDGVLYKALVRSSTLTVEQQAKIQDFHDFINSMKPNFDILQWTPPTELKIDNDIVNTNQLGQAGNDIVYEIGETLKEVLLDNYLR